MSKPIRITEAFLQEIKKDFEATLRSLKMSDGKVSYTKQFVWTSKEDDIPILEFTPLAYVKMVSLLQHYSSEVAWHGTVTRDPDNPSTSSSRTSLSTPNRWTEPMSTPIRKIHPVALCAGG